VGLKRALETQFDPDSISLIVVERESGGTALVAKTGKTYVLRIHNWSAYKFLLWLYYAPNLLCLRRKRAVAEELIRIYATKRDKDERDRLTEEATALRRQKMSHGRIMQILNITRTQAKNYTRSVKGIKAMDRTYVRKTDPALVASMRHLRQYGWNSGLIAKHLGVPKPTVEDNVRDIRTPVTRTVQGDVGERNRTIKRIVALLNEGKSCSEAAKLAGESLDKVKYWKRKACAGRPVTFGKRRTVTAEKKEQMYEFAKQNLTNEQISEKVGLSVGTVKKHLSGVRSG
jgi:predicted transcriptional regulator